MSYHLTYIYWHISATTLGHLPGSVGGWLVSW